MMTSSGMPSTSRAEEVEEAADRDDLGLPVGDDLGEAAGGDQHRQRGDERRRPGRRR